MCEYNGDIIRIDRLLHFIPKDSFSWNKNEFIDFDDIEQAMKNNTSEISDPFGDTYKHIVTEEKDKNWHIGRIIYFIKHPDEIRDIEIDNQCYGMTIYPEPIIVDGWHRYAAAIYLYQHGELSEIHCRYGGRVDVLECLQGKIDIDQLTY